MMSGVSPPYQYYVDLTQREQGQVPTPVRQQEPRPGHGTVYVTQGHDNTWMASWQDDIPTAGSEPAVGIAEIEGTQQAVLAWARSRPAACHQIFSPEINDYKPLTDNEP